MISSKATRGTNEKENLRRLLRERIAQVESQDPPRSADEQAAEDAFQVACTAARALVDDKDIASEEKMRVLQLMYTDCVKNVRALEYELGLDEKRLSVAELDYSELGEDLRKIETATEKLKAQSRELSKQNKIMLEESERRTAEERSKREEIVAKFDEAMRDINSKLSSEDSANAETGDIAQRLEQDYDELQKEYEERELYFQDALGKAEKEEIRISDLLKKETRQDEQDQEEITSIRKRISDIKKQTTVIKIEMDKIKEWRDEVCARAKERQESLKRQEADLKKVEQTERNVQKDLTKLEDETEELKHRSKEAFAKVKAYEEELEFWKAKSKSEFEKRETLERLCRTLTEERTIMRKEVQAMQAAWGMLEHEIENLRMEINDADNKSSSGSPVPKL